MTPEEARKREVLATFRREILEKVNSGTEASDMVMYVRVLREQTEALHAEEFQDRKAP